MLECKSVVFCIVCGNVILVRSFWVFFNHFWVK